MDEKNKTKSVVGTALLTAIVTVLQLLSNYIHFGPVSITLSLIPIVIGSILYGPISGMFLGLVNGCIVLMAPSTQASFMAWSPVGTIITCLLKTAIAGMVSGFVFKVFKNKEKLGVIICCLIVPIVNTGLFVVGCFTFFKNDLTELMGTEYQNLFLFIILSLIGFNFLIELFVNSILSGAAYKIINIKLRGRHHKNNMTGE